MSKRSLMILDRVAPGATRSLSWEVAALLLSVPASILMNRSLGAEGRGLFSIVTLVPMTLITIGSCQWNRLVTGCITSGKTSPNEAWRRTLYYTAILSAIVIPLGMVACLLQLQLDWPGRILSATYMLNFPCAMMGSCLSAIFIGMGSIAGQYWMRLALHASYLAIIGVLFLGNWLSVPWLIATHFAIWMISLTVGMAKVPKLLTGDVSRDRPPLVPLLKSVIPYALEVISANVDVWAFSMYSSVVVVGYYAGIAGLMQPIGLVSNSLVSGSTARLDWKNRATVLNYLKKATISLVAMMIGLAMLNSLVGAFLLKTLLGGSFEGGIWMIAWIAAIVVSRAVALQFHSALQLSGRQNSYLTVQFVDSLMRVGIVLGLGFCFKEIGILIGLVLTSVLKCVLCTIALKKSKV